MLAPFEAEPAAVAAAPRRHASHRPIHRRAAAALAASTLLSACVPATPPLAGNDPADPTAKVAAVGYRPVLAPYHSLRPVTPAPWAGHDDAGSPPAKPER